MYPFDRAKRIFASAYSGVLTNGGAKINGLFHFYTLIADLYTFVKLDLNAKHSLFVHNRSEMGVKKAFLLHKEVEPTEHASSVPWTSHFLRTH